MTQTLDGASLLLEIPREVVVELILEQGEGGIKGPVKGVEVVEHKSLGGASSLRNIADARTGEAAGADDVNGCPKDALPAFFGCLRR